MDLAQKDPQHTASFRTPDAPSPQPRVYRFGRCEVHPDTGRVFVDSFERRLQPRPLELLLYLIEHRGRSVGIEELARKVWGRPSVSRHTVVTTARRARIAIDDDRFAPLIRTCYRRGYQFTGEVSVEPSGRE